MRTLTLLAALLLLALQAQAQHVPEKAEEALEEQQVEEDQDTAISFEKAEHSGLQIADHQEDGTNCHCRKKGCRLSEQQAGSCIKGLRHLPYCCH